MHNVQAQFFRKFVEGANRNSIKLGKLGNFFLQHRVQTGSRAHPASYRMVTETLSLGVKRPESEADRSPPSSAEVNEWVELYLHSSTMSSQRGA